MKKLLLIAVVFGIVSFSSCKKDPPQAVIKVVNEAGLPVAGAEVIITADEGNGWIRPDNVKELILYTNSSGVLERTFLDDAIYDVLAQEKDDAEIVIRSGSGVLVLEVGTTCNETITIRP